MLQEKGGVTTKIRDVYIALGIVLCVAVLTVAPVAASTNGAVTYAANFGKDWKAHAPGGWYCVSPAGTNSAYLNFGDRYSSYCALVTQYPTTATATQHYNSLSRGYFQATIFPAHPGVKTYKMAAKWLNPHKVLLVIQMDNYVFYGTEVVY